MRNWCCLCFGYNDSKEKELMESGKIDAMEVEDKAVPENIDDSELALRLGLIPTREEGRELGAGGWKRDLESLVSKEGPGLDGLELSIGGSSGGNARGLGDQPHPPSSSSSGHRNVIHFDQLGLNFPASMESENFDRDLQNKRAKFDSYFQANRYAASGSSGAEDCSVHAVGSYNGQSSYMKSESSNVLQTCPVLMDSSHLNPIVPSEESNADASSMEESEIQMDLSDDLLHMVLSFLGHVDLCRASMVCKQWRSASAHEDFWRCLDFENRSISIEQLEDICRRYPKANEVNLSGPFIHLLVTTAVTLLRNLEALTLGRGQLGDTFFHTLVDCDSLKTLVVNDANLGNSVQEITINHDRLQHLQITKCRALRISVRCPQLETLSLKRSSMAHVVLNCPVLHDLDIGSCHKIPDPAVRSAVTSCTLLESLDMSNCSCVSDETLREISQTCGNLRVLNASYCPNISLESVRLPMLTVLKLESCEGITSASMAAIAFSSMLEELKLDNCSLLTSVSLDLPRLRNISLMHCRKFMDLNLRCLKLSSVSVWNSAALHRITITSNALKKLMLQKQESLTTLSLQCQYLQEIDLSDCESLTNSICDVLSDGGGCPMLKSLVLDDCESLTSVVLRSSSLLSLSLAGCRAVTKLELACPYVDQVRLDGCDHLERASFLPVGLQSLNLGICPKLSALHVSAPKMMLLELKGCGVLSEAFVDCPLLTSLDASFCSQLQDDCLSATAKSCPLIESLILMSCPSIGAVGLASLQCLQHLTFLDLSYTFLVDLQPVFDSCPRLKVLKLQACKYLHDASLEPLYKGGALPALHELDLSYGTLHQFAMEELLACCSHLTHVSLNGCANMHDLDWGFSAGQDQLPHRLLESLNCVGCPNIKNVYIPPTACCEHLSSLNLSLSANLKEVDIACPNLCFLNLSNCISLASLKLECARLTSLFLQSCNMDGEALDSAVSGCNMLETLDVRFCPKICSVSMGRLRGSCPSLKRIFSSLPAT